MYMFIFFVADTRLQSFQDERFQDEHRKMAGLKAVRQFINLGPWDKFSGFYIVLLINLVTRRAVPLDLSPHNRP